MDQLQGRVTPEQVVRAVRIDDGGLEAAGPLRDDERRARDPSRKPSEGRLDRDPDDLVGDPGVRHAADGSDPSHGRCHRPHERRLGPARIAGLTRGEGDGPRFLRGSALVVPDRDGRGVAAGPRAPHLGVELERAERHAAGLIRVLIRGRGHPELDPLDAGSRTSIPRLRIDLQVVDVRLEHRVSELPQHAADLDVRWRRRVSCAEASSASAGASVSPAHATGSAVQSLTRSFNTI